MKKPFSGVLIWAHQMNLTNARVELRPGGTIEVQLAIKASDIDRALGTRLHDERNGLADPERLTASSARIATYFTSHAVVQGGGVRMEHILRNVLMALLEQPGATLHDVLRMLSDGKFRWQIAESLQNETVRTFLLQEFDRFSFGYPADGRAPIQNKVGAFLADPCSIGF